MIKLNLTANGKAQERILAYLEENVSETIAEKINQGTPFEKDGKQLINKKSLDGFMAFASSEAQKLAEKGARSACVEDSVVYGWAIHYFEEDTIEGTLFNEDGTEYKTATKKNISPTTSKVTQTAIKVEPPKPKERQASLWDMLETTEKKPQDVPPMPEKNETTTITADGKTVDIHTGEILDDDTEEIEELTETEMRAFDGDIYEAKTVEEPQNNEPDDEQDENLPYSLSSFDRDTMIYLYELLDGKLDLA
jgi:hypothetical protein